MEDTGRIDTSVRSVLDARFVARETGITRSRTIIRSSANAIRALHRNDLESADRLLAEASEALAAVSGVLADHPDILHAGFVADAAKECAEAHLTRAVLTGSPLPLPTELGIDSVPYLHGLGETVGEARRRMLDLLRAGELDAAERLLGSMDAIVDLLATLDYPDGMTSGLRRTTDVARSLVERSRSDLTATVVQERLRQDIAGRL
jgi:translin